jgi:hypothetical protein
MHNATLFCICSLYPAYVRLIKICAAAASVFYATPVARPFFYTYIILTAVLRIRIHSGSGLRIRIQHFKWVLIGIQVFMIQDKPSALKGEHPALQKLNLSLTYPYSVKLS